MDAERMCREYDRFEYWFREFTTYFARLRHCAFPSPLLDWSKSPYVAAYFAFARAKHDGDVASFAYRERPNSFKMKQDLLWKITIPARERKKAIRFLDKSNLNEFTLFDSGELHSKCSRCGLRICVSRRERKKHSVSKMPSSYHLQKSGDPASSAFQASKPRANAGLTVRGAYC
jgi:hypothetical protein